MNVAWQQEQVYFSSQPDRTIRNQVEWPKNVTSISTPVYFNISLVCYICNLPLAKWVQSTCVHYDAVFQEKMTDEQDSENQNPLEISQTFVSMGQL